MTGRVHKKFEKLAGSHARCDPQSPPVDQALLQLWSVVNVAKYAPKEITPGAYETRLSFPKRVRPLQQIPAVPSEKRAKLGENFQQSELGQCLF